ncbi:Aste57867_10097 [Aphanomyces stellatus]|uniref:Aste57867_10097 protein n=1 Tax=Aphanomyces stellatus TaxID=120398 RepID=A0A485KPY9_9STRA|nr:hypothetical protein As57867_010058 [Aphanomyces stellatus]VFT86973.1 Aste57867_10097 [Aphanomyces stellatus]
MGVEMVPGTLCYAPDEVEAWLPAQVISHNAAKKQIEVKVFVTPQKTQERVVDFTDKKTLALMNGKGQPDASVDTLPVQNDVQNVDDMITLNYLHEAAILYNVKTRFLAQLPYTYTGDICIAVNPYQWQSALYTDEMHIKYQRLPRDELPPHVYATSVAAYKSMQHEKRNQSVLVSGESGAGKTETTKILMNHLATIAGGLNDATIAKIIMVNPLLESFGNAKTMRNDNSSRFGKFTQLQFDDKGTLVGAQCKTYLLEKTRVIMHEAAERNYHIFYQILASDLPELQLTPDVEYAYLGSLHTTAIEGHSDAHHFDKTKAALGRIGLSEVDQTVLFRALAGILHLGQVQFVTVSDEASQLSPQCQHVQHVCQLLGVQRPALESALCSRTVQARNDKYHVPLTKADAEQCRDALAKGLYANIFDWLVKVINTSLSNAHRMKHHIGVLDIFGFEHFKHNSFEQFCINYANEKLQQKFTFDVFKTVQVEYDEEGIAWNHIAYADNADVLQVIESKLGLISLLDEELVRPKGNEESFVAKAALLMKDDPVIEFPRTSRTHFLIHHYAAPVLYDVVGFLEKHKDALLPDLAQLMRSSTTSFVASMFVEPAADSSSTASAGKRRSTSRSLAQQTVGLQFKINLSELMGSIQSTKVQYIRCIKPNAVKSPSVLDHAMVISQLRCAGVIEAIRIARSAYPVRQSHHEFLGTYGMCYPDVMEKTMSSRDLCLAIMARLPQWTAPTAYQVGRSKIYFQAGVVEDLETHKRTFLYAKVVLMQRILRGCTKRRQYLRTRQAIIKFQSVVRCVLAMTRYHAIYRGMLSLQCRWRGIRARRLYYVLQRQHKAAIVYSFVRMAHMRCKYVRMKRSAVLIQSVFRMKFRRAQFRKRLADARSQESMQLQLRTLQARLQVEQTKDKDGDATSPEGRRRGKSSSQLVMADAGGMITLIETENVRLRRELEELQAAFAVVKDENDKLKQEKELTTAAQHVKLRQQEELVREKDKAIVVLQKDLEKLKAGGIVAPGSGGAQPPSILQYQSQRSRGSFRLGSRQSSRRLERSHSPEMQPLPPGVPEALAVGQKSGETNAFLADAAAKLGASLDVDATATRMALTNGLVSANSLRYEHDDRVRRPPDAFVRCSASPSVSSLKDRVAQMKNKYSQPPPPMPPLVPRTSEAEDAVRMSLSDSLYRGSIAVPPLPPGWEMRMSRSKGRPYFCNETLRLTLWDPPTEESIAKAIVKRERCVVLRNSRRLHVD